MIAATGQIEPEESLFTYPPGSSAADFSVPDHEPDFVDEVVANATQEVLDLCGTNVRCIFDATQTGDVNVGLDTMQQDSFNMETQEVTSKPVELKALADTLNVHYFTQLTIPPTSLLHHPSR